MSYYVLYNPNTDTILSTNRTEGVNVKIVNEPNEPTWTVELTQREINGMYSLLLSGTASGTVDALGLNGVLDGFEQMCALNDPAMPGHDWASIARLES